MSLVVAIFASFVVTAAALAVWLRIGRMPLDRANERSLHVGTVPRIGGIAMAAGIATGMAASAILFSSFADLQAILLTALGLFAVSLADDLRPLPVVPRLFSHLAAACLVVWTLDLSLGLGMIAILALAWMINLYNFMDGADGLAAGMTAIGFSVYGISALGSAPELAAVCLVIAAVACAFLLFNFPPARVFMGDAGSIPLGFLAGTIGLQGWSADIWSWWFPILVFLPFIADATVTLGRRICRHERIWQAHREHHYQRLILAGWSHRRLAVAAWILMTATAGSALVLQRLGY